MKTQIDWKHFIKQELACGGLELEELKFRIKKRNGLTYANTVDSDFDDVILELLNDGKLETEKTIKYKFKE